VQAGLLNEKLVVVVGDVRSGKTTFLKCIQEHFAGRAQFHVLASSVDSERELMKSVENIMSRKVSVMKLCETDGAHNDPDIPRYVVIDDIDVLMAGDRAIAAALVKLLAAGARFLVSIDTDGARKLKLKKGALVVYLDPVMTVDQLTRWVKNTLITDDVSEQDFVRAIDLCQQSGGHVADFMDAYLSGSTTVQPSAAIGTAPKWSRYSTYDAVAIVLTTAMSVEELLCAAESEGGSMIWQNVWQNAPIACSRVSYKANLRRMLDGVELEHAGHIQMERVVMCAGTTIAISPWCNAAPRVDVRKMVYTKTISNGGARALAKQVASEKAIAANLTVFEWARL
jgi:adenosyl cobinamide kinase/adenosyl cobinamide phosphate guanylyltransferase